MTSKQQAEKIFAAVAAGQTVFTKAADRWLIIGPAATVKPMTVVEVAKADGTTKQVAVDTIQTTSEKRGVAYAVASFRNLPTRTAAPVVAPREVHSAAFDRGVQYGDGATVYRGANGGRVQIWDD